ncbi:hypothetical protein SDC9_46787 [bioreactor metagenome]|uniref:Uncharacterized protein n=1 Tax=bioreactor metagenome TaxID=1076179 RepID=A0A644WAQ8_9ZZZZ
MRKQNFVLIFITVCLALCLSGCVFKTVSELYAVPKASEEFVKLQAAIDTAKGSAEQIAPLSGRNTQSVQMVDLDGDGVQEAVAFFRDTSVENPLKIYVFHQTDKGEYAVSVFIEGAGTAIESIAYENLGGSDALELVVSWRMSTAVHTLSAYKLENNQATELMRSGYSYYLPMDIDKDNLSELLVLQVDEAEETGQVEYYDYEKDTMVLRSSAPLSDGITTVNNYRSGYLKDNVPALFVLSEYAGGAVITDIFDVSSGKIKNITLNENTGHSNEILRFYTSAEPTDINGDSVLELPEPEALKVYNKISSADDYWIIKWRQYDKDGIAWPVCTTYHNYNAYDRWYLVLPDSWVGHFTLSRRETVAGSGERAMVFSYWDSDKTEEPQPFLVIYKLTGTDRLTRAAVGKRFVLLIEKDAIYAAEFLPCSWDCGLDADGVRANFDLIRTDWSTN